MSVIQSTQPELRYTKRQNLENEAKIVGNYYRDLIRSYGVDCMYHKLDKSEFANFKNTIDRNTILKQAYGYNITPDYSMSASTLTYMEIENDIFQLNKFGQNPNTDVNFYFENLDFACALATKCGQYKEYPINETIIECEVPECTDAYEEFEDDIDEITGLPIKHYLSSDVFPYELGLGYKENYYADQLSGKLQVNIDSYEVDKEQTIICNPYEHTDFNVKVDANSDLYKSLKHVIENDDYLETMIYLTFAVKKILSSYENDDITKPIYKYILNGRIHGNVLFYDINELGKYAEKIHPAVGDVITIDFPDENNQEKYEITDCFDKQLTQDGISPLLHKYIWKCKARRYINSFEDIEPNEADERLQEKLNHQAHVYEEVTDKISIYDNNDDKAYGGYDLDPTTTKNYDKQDIRNIEHVKYEGLPEGQLIDIQRFECGSKLCTDGYSLIFATIDNDMYIVAMTDRNLVVRDAVFESGMKWLKATKDQICFINIEGESTLLACNDESDNLKELNLESLYDATISTSNTNTDGGSFVKFNGCRSYLFATPTQMFAKLENTKQTHQLI